MVVADNPEEPPGPQEPPGPTGGPGVSSEPARLSAHGVTKRFPGVLALSGVDFEVRRGEVLAVVGENGAGKSTLMKVLAGVQSPDEGTLAWEGAPLHLASPREALDRGIALIHQELSLADNLTAAANMFLGREPRRGWRLDHRGIESRARKLLERVGATFDPRTPVAQLSIGHRQQVEIAKALASEARVLILDEPTSSLSDRETERLMVLCEQLRDEGTSLVYISHRLLEVERLADRVLVLRDGEVAGNLGPGEITQDGMVRTMVGAAAAGRVSRGRDRGGDQTRIETDGSGPPGQSLPVDDSSDAKADSTEPLLAVEGLRTRVHPGPGIAFELHPGEIVGIAGLLGSGRTELLEALFGIEPWLGGSMVLGGEAVAPRSPREALASGIGLVPEDRKAQGLILDFSIASNLSLADLVGRRRRLGIERLDHAQEAERSHRAVLDLGVRCASIAQTAGLLSGGNQQKVALGRALERSPRVLLLDEPTRGVDIGARHELYTWLRTWVRGGGVILFASSELDEIMGLADRALVLREGRLAGELERGDFSEEGLLRLATSDVAHESTDRPAQAHGTPR